MLEINKIENATPQTRTKIKKGKKENSNQTSSII
jgi:hypothetical protein